MKKKKRNNRLTKQQLEKLKNIRELCLEGFLNEEGYSDNLEEVRSRILRESSSPFTKIRDICTKALNTCSDHVTFDNIYWLTILDNDGKPIRLPGKVDIHEKLKFADNDYLVLFAKGRPQSDFACEIRTPAAYELWRRAKMLESILKIAHDFYLGSVLLNKR
jgi:hypothetical protein